MENHTCVISKVDEEQRRVWGWAYMARNADGDLITDHSGDVIDTPEAFAALEDATYRFVKDIGEGDDMHTTFGVAKVIESVVMSPVKAEAMGLSETNVPQGVWLGMEFERDAAGDAAWAKFKQGERRMFSIVGEGTREPL